MPSHSLRTYFSLAVTNGVNKILFLIGLYPLSWFLWSISAMVMSGFPCFLYLSFAGLAVHMFISSSSVRRLTLELPSQIQVFNAKKASYKHCLNISMNIFPHPTLSLSNCETGSYYAVLSGFGFTGAPCAGINSMHHQAHPILQMLTFLFLFSWKYFWVRYGSIHLWFQHLGQDCGECEVNLGYSILLF